MRKTKLIMLIACLVLIGSINASAKEVVIYVSGPWIYAQDPTTGANDRVVVFVAVSHNHLYPQLFPGGDYTHPDGKPTLYQGFYKLDLPNGVSGSCTSKSNPYRLKENLTITIGGTVINDEIVSHKYAERIAISLPKPACYMSLHTSESQVGTAPNKLVQDKYTTLMALHYFVGNGRAHLSGTSDDSTVTLNDDIAFVSTTQDPLAISLVMMAKDTKSEILCDSYSHESLVFSRRSLALDGKMFAQFPELKADGSGQKGGKYNNCSNDTVRSNEERKTAAINVLDNIQKLRAYVADQETTTADAEWSFEAVEEGVHKIFGDEEPQAVKSEIEDFLRVIKGKQKVTSGSSDLVFERTDGIVWPFTVGGGDCHMAQISVNSVIP